MGSSPLGSSPAVGSPNDGPLRIVEARLVVLWLRTAALLVLEVRDLVDEIVRAAACVGVFEVLAIMTDLVLAQAATTENMNMNAKIFTAIRIVVILLFFIPNLPIVGN
jgi:hypothetical protein